MGGPIFSPGFLAFGSLAALGGQARSTLAEGDMSSASKVGGSGASFAACAPDEGNFTKKKV